MTKTLSLSLSLSRRFAVTLAGLIVPAVAQVPATVTPLPNRQVHPAIAPPAPGAIRNGSGPLFQYPEPTPKWNHGEGFAAGSTPDADYGGWFNNDDGSNVTINDVHAPLGWQSWTWTDPLHPLGTGAPMARLVGYLRPAGLGLPSVSDHPLYGDPVGNDPATYVDQGAFELFRPSTPAPAPMSTDKIIIVIYNWPTHPFPAGSVTGAQIYEGFYSPDGLVRAELGPTRAEFFLNVSNNVGRPGPVEGVIGTLPASATYWPITGYAVTSVPGRQTSLNEQRNMQLLQAIKLLLQDPGANNPLGAGNQLSAQGIIDRVVVVFVGSSNGGHQAMWSAMRYPDRIHGSWSEVINPSIQRLFGEHDLAFALGRLSGAGNHGGTVTEWDFMNWGQYTWNQNLWIHDISHVRRFLRGQIYRPAFFRVGDEDVTSTGTDWAGVANGGAWAPVGVRPAPSITGWPNTQQLAWTIAENTCHQNSGLTVSPYGGSTWYAFETVHDLISKAMTQRAAELLTVPPPVVAQPIAENRAGAQQLRGLDDPHEWALGRQSEAMPTHLPTDILRRDDPWFAAVQPGAAGTALGLKEAMLIRDGKLYVVGAEGVVSCFDVDQTPGHKQRLRKLAHSNPVGADPTPMSLGQGGFAMAAVPTGGSWQLAVGTRRYLYLLNPVTLEVQSSVQLPWEVAQPHHMKVGDVLTGPGAGGAEIVFASMHGGLVFYSVNLAPLYEWPEPGIVDFLLDGSTVSILSQRGVVADVQFVAGGGTYQPQLLAASRPLPRKLLQYVDPMAYVPALDSPSQGNPQDLELMRVNLGAAGTEKALVALWSGDEDGTAVRAYKSATRTLLPFVPHTELQASGLGKGLGNDIAVCHYEAEDETSGDHLLVLVNDTLVLYDSSGGFLGKKFLQTTNQAGNTYSPFGSQTQAMAVGDLVPNSGAHAEEVVIATASGALMWLHIDDLMEAPANVLGPSHYVDTAKANPTGSTHEQPRTNESLGAAWAMALRSDDHQLHLLDPRGAYWQVNHSGQVKLWERDWAADSARGWDDLGNRNAAGNPIALSSPAFPSPILDVIAPVPGISFVDKIATHPWCPQDVHSLYLESAPAGIPHLANNWKRDAILTCAFEGFIVHRWGGALVDLDVTTKAAWYWSARGKGATESWGNLLEGLCFDESTWQVTGHWASTGDSSNGPSATATADLLRYHDLRSFVSFVPIMTQQAMRAVVLQTGQVALVLGCPGGRVHVVRPGVLRTSGSTLHTIGTDSRLPDDYGLGMSALDAKLLPSGDVQIWFGTVYGPTPEPGQYTIASGSLQNGEVATGVVHTCTWSPSAIGHGFGPVTKRPLPPGTTRGGYGVLGICVDDLLPDTGSPADEVVVTTLAGDVIVFTADLQQERWRTHVPGAVGNHNSIRCVDLNGDGHKELYVGGSYGLWRFIQPSETDLILP